MAPPSSPPRDSRSLVWCDGATTSRSCRKKRRGPPHETPRRSTSVGGPRRAHDAVSAGSRSARNVPLPRPSSCALPPLLPSRVHPMMRRTSWSSTAVARTSLAHKPRFRVIHAAKPRTRSHRLSPAARPRSLPRERLGKANSGSGTAALRCSRGTPATGPTSPAGRDPPNLRGKRSCCSIDRFTCRFGFMLIRRRNGQVATSGAAVLLPSARSTGDDTGTDVGVVGPGPSWQHSSWALPLPSPGSVAWDCLRDPNSARSDELRRLSPLSTSVQRC